MMPLSLFKVRNFAVANMATLTVYAGLMGGFFFIGLFLQQVLGYTPFEAGIATMPVSVLLFVLSPRFGKLTAGRGPRLPMTVGPIVAGIGMVWLGRVGLDPSYTRDILPPLIVFGLGLAATVAPLTTTVLNSVEERHVGIASGINNGVSRVAGLLAIAVLGPVRLAAGFDPWQQAPEPVCGGGCRGCEGAADLRLPGGEPDSGPAEAARTRD
jgi:predicted MFS family arabinose efflux permease